MRFNLIKKLSIRSLALAAALVPTLVPTLLSILVPSIALSQESKAAEASRQTDSQVTETVKIDIPSDFKLGFSASSKTERIVEFVPVAEVDKIEKWSEMITAQMFNNRFTNAEQFVTSVTEGWLKTCAGGLVISPQSQGVENGYRYSSVALHCPHAAVDSSKELSETVVVKVIQGKEGLYSIQRAYRGPLDGSMTQLAAHYVSSASLCDDAEPAHACASREELK